MTVVSLVRAHVARYGQPTIVLMGLYLPVDGRRVDDPFEILNAIRTARSREMSWDDAFPALESLGNKRAADIRIDTANWTMWFKHNGTGWHMRTSHPRTRDRRADSAVSDPECPLR